MTYLGDFADWQYEVANGDTRLGYFEWSAQHDTDEEENA